MKVHIVTEGNNNGDDNVAGIFRTGGLAKRFMRHYHTNSGYDLHERTVFEDWSGVVRHYEREEENPIK